MILITPAIQLAHRSRPRWVVAWLALTWVSSLLFLDGAAAQTLQPDLGGWSSEVADQRPANALATEPAARDRFVPPPLARPLPKPPRDVFVAEVSAVPDVDVRQQIGLASFESAVEAKEAAVPVEPRTNQFASFEQPAAATESTPESAPFDFSSLSQVFASSDGSKSRSGLGSTVSAGLLLAALSLAPAIILMTTSYVRVVVVLSLLRQAFGSQNLPPTQVITALSLFLTMLIMTPVWNEIKRDAIDPYSAADSEMTWEQAWEVGVQPVRLFMQKQIQLAGNEQSISTFYQYLPDRSQSMPTGYDDVPFNVLLPAFMVSELKVAFLLGFQVFLPFLVLDLVVSSVTVSMGMLMLPPNMVSFPLKLILFVMVDGWNLVVGMLLQSFGPVG